MKESGIKLFKAGDLIICLTVIAVAAVLIFFPFIGKESRMLAVSVDGSKQFYALDENREITIENNGILLTVTVSSGTAFVSSSSCPDGICVATGKISKSGQIIVCAPANVAVWIEDGGENGYDAVTG